LLLSGFFLCFIFFVTSVSIPKQIHNLEIDTVSNATFTSKLLDVLLPQKVQPDTENPNQDTKTTENTENTEELCLCCLNSVSSVLSVVQICV